MTQENTIGVSGAPVPKHSFDDMTRDLRAAETKRSMQIINRFAPVPATTTLPVGRAAIIQDIVRFTSQWILKHATTEELATIHTAIMAARQRTR